MRFRSRWQHWRRWFAWYMVHVGPNEWRWLEIVECRDKGEIVAGVWRPLWSYEYRACR